MPVTVVVGTQWGDEGKAKIIDLLAGNHSHVVRYQGGHNAGHTVVVGDQRYALQLVPSGVLYEHVTPVIGNGVVVDMPTLFNEIDVLESRGVSCSRLKVSSLAQLIFPWHQAFDAVAEIHRILKPGGVALITTPYNFRIHGPLPDCWRFTEHGLRALFSKGFEVKELVAVETEDRFLMPIHYRLVAQKL